MSNYMPLTAEHHIERCGTCPESEGFCSRIVADKCEDYFLGEEPGIGHLTVLARKGRIEDKVQVNQATHPLAHADIEKTQVNPKYL